MAKAQTISRRVVEALEPRTLLAATYYIATTGNNASAGNLAAPWRTLQYAADHVHAGDTVIVEPGSYTGFNLETSGTPTARITFKAQSGAVINAVNGVTKDGINLENASYITIDGFTLIGTNDPTTSRAGIRAVGDGFDTGVFSKGVIIQNNHVDRWGVWGIFTAFADDCVIQSNICSRSAQQHGIYFSNSADRPTIRYNTCWGNAGSGIQLNADINTGNTGLPNVDGITTGALVDGNTCYDNGTAGGSAINCDGVQNSRIVNNVLYNNHASGISLFDIDGAEPSKNDVVANNTIIQPADGRWCLNISDGSSGTTIFNNIFFNLHSFRGSISIDAASKPGTASDYNFVDPRFSDDDTSLTLAQWKTDLGGSNESHSTSLTLAQMQALFKNYAANDFTLASASAAIDKGTSSLTNGTLKSAPGFDRLKNSRPAGAGYDVGAYESVPPKKFLVVDGGRLVFPGTPSSDVMSMSLSGSTLTASRNGASQQISISGITSIEIYGDDGDDSISIGAGIIGVYVNAGAGNDVVHGGAGSDTLTAGAGKDQLFGGGGNDLLNGNTGPDKLYGDAGNDRVHGGDSNDYLVGGSGNDSLWGDAGNNIFYGQDGTDYLYARNSIADTLNGGSGTNFAQCDPGATDAMTLVQNLLA